MANSGKTTNSGNDCNDSQNDKTSVTPQVKSNSISTTAAAPQPVIYGVSTEKRMARSSKDKSAWMLDSGANRHGVNNASYFIEDSVKRVNFVARWAMVLRP